MNSSQNHNGAWKIAAGLVCALITTITTLSLFITAGIKGDVVQIRSRLFTHLTNHEIHIPRDQVVSKAEFNMYCYTAEKNIERLIEEMNKKKH